MFFLQRFFHILLKKIWMILFKNENKIKNELKKRQNDQKQHKLCILPFDILSGQSKKKKNKQKIHSD